MLERQRIQGLWGEKPLISIVAYAAETHTRTERANQAKPAIREAFADLKQQEFIEFILKKYVEDGVKELAPGKLKGLISIRVMSNFFILFPLWWSSG